MSDTVSVDSDAIRAAAQKLEDIFDNRAGSGNQRDQFERLYRSMVVSIEQAPLELGNNLIIAAFIDQFNAWYTKIIQNHFDGYVQLAKALHVLADQYDTIKAE